MSYFLADDRAGLAVDWVRARRMRVLWHATFVGGALPGGASASQRLAYRVSMASGLRSYIVSEQQEWRPSTLLWKLETTEKALGAFRIGMTFAGVLGAQSLDLSWLAHRQSILGETTGDRGDLCGRDSRRRWHGVEAKGHAPNKLGNLAGVTQTQYEKAKDQAEEVAGSLAKAFPGKVGDDHWALTTRTKMGDPVRVVYEDPPPGEHPPPPGSGDGDLLFEDPEERLLQSFYQVVGDIEQQIEAGGGQDSGLEDIDAMPVRGVPVGRDWWLGARAELFDARREGRLSGMVDALRETVAPFENARSIVDPTGLVLVDLRDSDSDAGWGDDDGGPPGWRPERTQRLLVGGSPGWLPIIAADAHRTANVLEQSLHRHRGHSVEASIDVVREEAGTPERFSLWAQARAQMHDHDRPLAHHWSDMLSDALAAVLFDWSNPAPEQRARALVEELRRTPPASGVQEPDEAGRSRSQRLLGTAFGLGG